MRRLIQHAMAAAGVSVLTAGVVAGSLVSGSARGDSMTVAAPVLASSVPVVSTSAPLSTEESDRRLVRDTRGSERVALATTVSDARARALRAQHAATARQEATLEKKKKAEEKRRAEAKKKAAAKHRAEQQRRRAAAQQRAEQAKKRAAAARKKAAAKHTESHASGGSPRAIARSLMQSRYGWGASQFSCYNKIIMRESGWNVHADNPSSSAYGIPQALPGSKMASAGPDWRNNAATQIKWGLGYVKSRYGTPCGAWGFKHSHGWY